MSVYIQCAAKTSGMDFTKGRFVGILGYLIIIRSIDTYANSLALASASIHKAFAIRNCVPLAVLLFHAHKHTLPSPGSTCLAGCHHLHREQQREPPLWAELLSQEYVSLSCPQTYPCCCELMLKLAFHGCW